MSVIQALHWKYDQPDPNLRVFTFTNICFSIKSEELNKIISYNICLVQVFSLKVRAMKIIILLEH